MQLELKVEQVGGRRVVSSGRRWEPLVGYSRAVRVGDTIAVTGSVGVRPDGSYPEEPAEQMRLALRTVVGAIEALGGKREDVIRTRMFVTDISRWEEMGRVHGEFFGDVRPATSMIEISGLIDPEALVEVEADAIVFAEASG